MYKVFSWTAVILWMLLICNLSNQPATKSNQLSTGITEVIVENVEKIIPNAGTNIGSFNHIVRKNAHFAVYFVLGVLLINALRKNAIYSYQRVGLALLICILYAASDEFHQLFVPGRGGQIKDVLIDSVGASVGIGTYLLINQIVRSRKNR
ncbi:VanZ family protein [Bacillus fengqiuensis]|nr:VanZ family protein [Bacillus fengqiuensis]